MSTRTLGTRSHLTVVNPDPSNAVTGAAVVSLIVAEAARRPHLVDAIQGLSYSPGRVGVIMRDAGTRQHLANALGFGPDVHEGKARREGKPYMRSGEMVGIEVNVWNVEP